MDDKKVLKDHNEKNEWDLSDTKTVENESNVEDNGIKNLSAMRMQTSQSTEDDTFSDIKQYPESPFNYFETNQLNVRLSTGDVQYEVTDFVLPGKDGFDISIARRYDSGCANLEDMDPHFKNDKLTTGSKSNSYYAGTYGLGYGWSFVLPSIETVRYLKYSYIDMSGLNKKPIIIEQPAYDYILHLEDGRSLKMSRYLDGFLDYSLKDINIIESSGTIQHPYAPHISKNYDIIIEYKNGNRDYFKDVMDLKGKDNSYIPYSFKLKARKDKFGNVIFYDLQNEGGLTMIDTWGRSISLEKTDYGLVWNLPESTAGKECKIVYQVDRSQPLKLISVTDPEGNRTQYNYYNPEDYKGIMRYSTKKAAGHTTEIRPRRYLLLESITYPNQASTQFTYGKIFYIINDYGGRMTHFGLTMKKDVANGAIYNQSEYDYKLDSGHTYDTINGYYINYADVKHHQDILETHQFDSDGLLVKKEVRHQNLLISKSVYEYRDKLIVSEVDQVFDRNNESKHLEKKTFWKYSTDRKANVIQLLEEYSNDSSCNQEVNTSYGDYSIIVETQRKKGNDQIRETNELDTELGNRVIKFHCVYQNGVLKEKTGYDYNDSQNSYSVTNERRYYLTGSGNLEQSNEYTEIIYKYSNPSHVMSRYTNKFISKEQNGIKDADGRPCDLIKEEYQYDNWGRMITKKDARNQITTFGYDKMGRVVSETSPPSDGQQVINENYYNVRLNYITKTDANHQKRRIQYTPLGQIQQVCLAVSNEPGAGDVVLQDYRYNTWGEMTEVITYDGTGTAANQVRKTEYYTYDSFGRVLSREILQVGYEEKYEYNEVFTDPADGTNYFREIKKIIGDPSAPDIVTERYKDQKGQIRKELLAGEKTFVFEYDNAGNNIRKVNARNKEERWEYDYANRAVKSIRMESDQARVTSTQYDALGNKRFQWDESGKQTEFQYDHAGRLIQIISPFDHRSQIVKYYYDGAENVIGEKKAQDHGWQETRYVYDARNRLIETCQYLSSDSWIKTVCQYNVLDQVILRRTGDTPYAEGREVVKYVYDRFGNVTAMTDARGCTEYLEYDKVGRLIKKTDRNKDQIIYQNDALDRLIKETIQKSTSDGLLMSEREYAYSKSGKRIREISKEFIEGKQRLLLETKYYYNNRGQLSYQEDPGNTKKYTYDIYGNRQTFQLSRIGKVNPEINLYYIYDDLYHLKQVRKNSAAGEVLSEYEYDEKGNRKILRYPQAGMETIYQYNDGNRVISLENKRQGTIISAWQYSYDVDGNILSKINREGPVPVTISYSYDSLGRLTAEDYSVWKRTLYTYDSYSNRIKMMVEGRTKDELVSVTSYEYGLNNRLEKEIKKQGKITEKYQYRYDDNGNETFRIWEKTSPTPDYPGNVKLTGGMKIVTPTVYEWRHYNGFNQLIRINQDEKEITYQYRGDELRHSVAVRELTKSQNSINEYYWDGSNIVGEQVDKETLKIYIRGINLIACETDHVLYYYILNEHGDVAQQWDPNGACKSSYEYDAFGAERNPDKEDKNPFRYCGEYIDLETNTYYLRARSYRPGTGRFLSEDSVEAVTRKMPNKQEIPDPLSLNKHTYCHNNPVSYIDPTGHVPLLVVTALVGLVAGAIAGGVSSAMKGNFSWTAVFKGAAIGATIGLTGGATLAYGVTGSALASTGAVASGLGFGVTTAGSTGAAGFNQARQLVQAQQVKGAEGAGVGLNESTIIPDYYVAPNGKALPGQYKEWLGENMRDSLMNSVSDPTLKKAIGEVFRPGSIIGDGGTADIIKFEKETGILLSKSGHIQKGIDMSKYFQKLIDSATLSSADAKVAQNILNSFKSVLGGK
jgi:RHS repeat-associated protein